MTYPQGRRRPDTTMEVFPDDIQAGDYWKLLDHEGNELLSDSPTNLTHTRWMVVAPLGEGTSYTDGYGLGNLYNHTVREEDDGTISVRPGDGSSNSILISKGANGPSWHGYIEHGIWREA